jgi:hypothetical protein
LPEIGDVLLKIFLSLKRIFSLNSHQVR